ncbi:MAG: hypothetical protein AAGF60_03750 [Pseudomonadota bacterium]
MLFLGAAAAATSDEEAAQASAAQRAGDESLFKEAMAFLRAGAAAEAVERFSGLAQRGHSAAQVNLAILYTRGEGVPSSRIAASYWSWRARLMGDRRAIALSDALLGALPPRSRNAVADRLAPDLEELAAEGRFQAFLALGRLETEIRTPPRLDEAGVWLMLAAAFEVPRAPVVRDRLIAAEPDARRLAMEARAGAAFAEWCARLAPPLRPVSCGLSGAAPTGG